MAAVLPTPTDCCQVCQSPASIVITSLADLAGFFEKKSIAEVRTIPNVSTNRFVAVGGEAEGGDGFLGSFGWDSESVLADDGAGVIKPDDTAPTSPGRWIRIT